MTDEELYQLLCDTQHWADRPFTTAPEIAERVGLSRQAIHERLQTLVSEYDDVRKYKPGQSAIYWVEN